MLIIVEVELLIDALTVIIVGVLSGIGVDVLVEVTTNVVLAGVMTDLEFAISEPLNKFSCSAAFDC